jgi:hypothetical protein
VQGYHILNPKKSNSFHPPHVKDDRCLRRRNKNSNKDVKKNNKNHKEDKLH